MPNQELKEIKVHGSALFPMDVYSLKKMRVSIIIFIATGTKNLKLFLLRKAAANSISAIKAFLFTQAKLSV